MVWGSGTVPGSGVFSLLKYFVHRGSGTDSTRYSV